MIFDPHCNPTNDLQAADRAHRLGQICDVDVFRFISAGTVEEVIFARQIYKNQQAESILSGKPPENRHFHGVPGQKGERFGYKNLLFDYQADQRILRRVLQSSDTMETSGIYASRIDVKEDDDGDLADHDNENDLLQLANEICDGDSPGS